MNLFFFTIGNTWTYSKRYIQMEHVTIIKKGTSLIIKSIIGKLKTYYTNNLTFSIVVLIKKLKKISIKKKSRN
jgi:hypothetical protein